MIQDTTNRYQSRFNKIDRKELYIVYDLFYESSTIYQVKKNYMLMEDYVREVYAEEFEEAEKKAKEQGMKKGMAKGIQQGMAKGIEQRNLELAKQMLLEHEPIDKIVKYTGLSIEEITHLSSEKNIKK